MPEYKRFKLDNFDSTREMLELLDTQRLIISDMEKKNQELKKENEQLKKDLKRCREWLNSDKYDYTITLAFIKSKGYSLKDVLEYKGDIE